ncbi:MAG: NlpC/P60 family protein [Oliverpabstia sp.]|nr:NlpC/P60 family protein [Oliverpabstia sp.]
MQEHEYRARDKTVKKMSREGLMEENLQSRESVMVSQRERESLTLPGQAVDSIDFQSSRNHRKEEAEAQTRRRLYASDLKKTDPDNRIQEQSAGEDDKETEAPRGISDHSARMEGIRGHPSGSQYAQAAAEISHNRKKQQVQTFARKEKENQAAVQGKEADSRKESGRYHENQQAAEQSLDGFREEIKQKTRREQLRKEQQKKVSRLSFGDEEGGMVRGAGAGMAKKAVSMAAGTASVYLHGKGHEAEQDNAAVEGSHKAELMAENALRYTLHRTNRGLHRKGSRLQEDSIEAAQKSRLQYETVQEAGKSTGKQAAQIEQEKKRAIRRFWQKQRYKKAYQAAKEGEQATQISIQTSQTFLVKTKKAVEAVIRRNRSLFGAAAVVILLFVLAATSLSSCSAFLQGGTTTVVGTTYPSTDDDIYAVENAYKALENALNAQINSMESRHPGYDEYRYQVDEISHNPYHLISYFTAKYGEFTYEQVKDEVEEIFRQQYGISTESTRETVTETRTVRVGESLGQVVTSGYCNCSICCGVWSGGPTASGVYPTANHTIAVDAANPFVPMGTKIIMNGVEYVVEDTGNFARYGVQFDVYYGDHASASAHGHQTWEAYIADSNGSREVEVTSTHEVNCLDVSLTNHNLDAVLRSRMDENEEKRYDIYNTTLGNRDYLFDNVPSYGGGGFGYDIPAEALSDRKFANMIREAEKYLGYPYVWGGSSPSTSFDCSGFVSWVINNCGNGWNVGRQTADGLRGCCSYVSPSEAKPGDLIFFQGTYNTPGANHVGIYVGNNMMIHCGNPIQYTSISSSYWQQHFMAFGRIH